MRVRTAAMVCAIASVLAAAEPPASGAAFFEARIRPVLIKHCLACHSAEAAAKNKLKAGLALDTRDGLMRGGENGPAIVPGKPDASLLILSIRHAVDAPEMPPEGKLPAAVIADFEQWVRMGAPDPRTGAAPTIRKGMSVQEGRKLPMLQVPRNSAPPAVKRLDWPADPIDRFVLARLEPANLSPAGDADRRSLIRRLHFDLIGLPPSPAEVEAFAADESPEAFARVVDRLLASPHFGERWGRHWLDSARYADSNGRDRNILWHHARHYRDYVIASFNADKPYDRFVREQIAGDLMPAASPAQRDQQRVATGLLALGAKAFEEQNPDIFRMDVVDEQIEVIGRTILGLSIGCARCHDHKFDPIPTRDYYAIAGILRSTQTLHGLGPLGIKATAHSHSELQPIGPDADTLGPAALRHARRVDEMQLRLNTARSDRYRVVRNIADAKNRLDKPGSDKAKLQADIDRMEAEVKAWDAKIKAIDGERTEMLDNPVAQPLLAMAARDRPDCADCRVHIRGETGSLGDSVPRGMLQVIDLGGPVPGKSGSGRLELADWLTARGNPLTARVFANRVWQHLFGRGLSTTPDDFGVNGSKPSHPELLDHLAVRFMDGGWSIKKLIRGIVSSRTYRMASDADDAGSAADPDNVLLWRMSPRRLQAEALRDAMMSVAGTLDPSPPAAPYLSRLHEWRENEFRTFSPVFTPEQIEHAHRSVYLPVIRGVLPEVFALFDFAAPDRPVARRDESVVPSQALYLMNGKWVIAQATAAAARLHREEPSNDAARVDRLWRLAYGRPPTTDEAAAAAAYSGEPERLIADPKAKSPPSAEQLRAARWVSLCQAVFASAEFRQLR